MKTVLIVNAGIRAQGKSGKINEEMTRLAREAFEAAGVKTLLTDLNNEWTLEGEIEKILAADLILVQTPIWAMSTPWHYTRWQDEVLTHPKVCGTDGRTRTDPDKKYGSGGFLTSKRYWLSTTWNAPKKGASGVIVGKLLRDNPRIKGVGYSSDAYRVKSKRHLMEGTRG